MCFCYYIDWFFEFVRLFPARFPRCTVVIVLSAIRSRVLGPRLISLQCWTSLNLHIEKWVYITILSWFNNKQKNRPLIWPLLASSLWLFEKQNSIKSKLLLRTKKTLQLNIGGMPMPTGNGIELNIGNGGLFPAIVVYFIQCQGRAMFVCVNFEISLKLMD